MKLQVTKREGFARQIVWTEGEAAGYSETIIIEGVQREAKVDFFFFF